MAEGFFDGVFSENSARQGLVFAPRTRIFHFKFVSCTLSSYLCRVCLAFYFAFASQPREVKDMNATLKGSANCGTWMWNDKLGWYAQYVKCNVWSAKCEVRCRVFECPVKNRNLRCRKDEGELGRYVNAKCRRRMARTARRRTAYSLRWQCTCTISFCSDFSEAMMPNKGGDTLLVCDDNPDLQQVWRYIHFNWPGKRRTTESLKLFATNCNSHFHTRI